MATTDQQLGAGIDRAMDADDPISRIWSSAPMTIARRMVVTTSQMALNGVATGARWMGRSGAIAPHAIVAGALRSAEVARDDWRRREHERTGPSIEAERIEVTIAEVGTPSSKPTRTSSSKATGRKPTSRKPTSPKSTSRKPTKPATPTMTSTPTVNPPTSTPG